MLFLVSLVFFYPLFYLFIYSNFSLGGGAGLRYQNRENVARLARFCMHPMTRGGHKNQSGSISGIRWVFMFMAEEGNDTSPRWTLCLILGSWPRVLFRAI